MIQSQANIRMLSLLCSNGQNIQEERVKIACSLVGVSVLAIRLCAKEIDLWFLPLQTNLLKEASKIWRETGMAILPLPELSKAAVRLSNDLNNWPITVHVSPHFAQQTAQQAARAGLSGMQAPASHGPSPSQQSMSTVPKGALDLQALTPGGSELVPRLRVEDLSLPPAKRAKGNPQATSSPVASGSPSGSTPNKGQGAGVAGKKPAKKPLPKRKTSVSNNASGDAKPSPAAVTPAEENRVTPSNVVQRMLPPALNPVAEFNALGVRLGEEAVKARLQEEEKGRLNPIDFLSQSLTTLAEFNEQSGLAHQAMDEALGFSLPTAWADGDWEMRRVAGAPSSKPTTAAAWEVPVTHPAEEVFDYSFFIDDSALNDDDEEEEEDEFGDKATAGPSKHTSGIDSTPELSTAHAVDPSPASENAITPAATKHGNEHVVMMMPAMSPTVQRNDAFGEDGWLNAYNPTAGLKWDGDNTPGTWPMETVM